MSCSGEDRTISKFRKALIVTLESNIVPSPRPGYAWLGPKGCIEDSAEASVEAAAMASATLAANTSMKIQKSDSINIPTSSALVKEGSAVALFGELKGTFPIIMLKYKTIEKDAFVFRYRRTFKRKGVYNEGNTIESLARSTTVKATHFRLKRQISKLRALSHENVTQFIVAAVPTSADHVQSLIKTDKSRCFTDKFFIVIHACNRGTLEDALCATRFPLPDVIKLSLCRDLLTAVKFLHKQGPVGKISSRTCFVTEDWRLRVYPGNFDGLGERLFDTNSFDLYGIHAARLFAPPEDIEHWPVTHNTKPGDVYSVGLLINMIWNDGVKPFVEYRNLEEIIKQLPIDTTSVLRPPLPHKIDPELAKILQNCWLYHPDDRPQIRDVLVYIKKRLEKFISRECLNIELHLMKTYSKEVGKYMLALERAQSHLSINLGEAVTKRLAESESTLQAVKAEYQHQIESLTRQLNQEQEHAVSSLMSTKQEVERHVEVSHMEADAMRSRVKILEKDCVAARLAMLPVPISKLLLDPAATYFSQNGYYPEFDLIYKPLVFRNATILVVSIAGFNRYVQQLANYPKTLLEVLKCYYLAVDNAIEASTAPDHEPTVFCVDRISDACILVSGAPETNDRAVSDILKVGVKLIQWASRWDATKYLSSSTARMLLRIGVHTGPVIGGLIGKVPKLLLMGETVNVATMIETQCSVQEMRLSKEAHTLLEKTRDEGEFIFEQVEDLDLKQGGKLGVFKVIVDRGK
ncbi:kinase-like domain-containing protein [Chytriomyces sp. MP71]|nr:kinase-like domain-containing protein [Chytriomyces sp. MP71]